MAPEKQVSPAIRILWGERDVSARATHLEAATRKFLVTTNERKQMSIKTNFKRVALVVTASLGLSLLGSVPSQANVGASVVTTVVNGTATTATSDSSTAATVRVQFLSTAGAAVGLGDSVVVSTIIKSSPTGASNSNVNARLLLNDTGTAGTSAIVDTNTSFADLRSRPQGTSTAANTATYSATPDAARANFIQWSSDTSADNYSNAQYKVYLDTTGGGTLTAGTYVLSLITTPYDNGAINLTNQKSVDVSVVVSAVASASLTTSASYSTAVLSSGTSDSGSTLDSSVVALATASTTAAAVIKVTLKNASNVAVAAMESVTVTTDKGVIGTSGTAYGRSITFAYTSTSLTIDVRPDGTAGVATIKVSTPTLTFADKRVTFYSATVNSITNTMLTQVIGSGSTSAVLLATAKDSSGNLNAADDSVYAYSSDTSIISNNGTACTYSSAYGGQICSLTGVANGKAKITLRDATTAAASTKASNAVEITVNLKAASSIKLSLNKATYAPGEKAYVILTPLDADGNPTAAISSQPLLSSAGVYTTAALGTNSADLVTGYATISTASNTGSGGAYATAIPVKQWVIYMPNSGEVTLSAKGGTYLPESGQVTVTAKATVTNNAEANAAAALAAVTSLATTVASLKTLITTLTNLVLKIQKKVKA